MSEEPAPDLAVGERGSGARRLGRLLLRHPVEVGFAIFAVAFAVVLPFIDTGNLTRFLLAASYLSVGRNPYTVFPYPPPPGLFAVTLPTFAAYALSGHDLFVADFSLKLWGIAGLVAAGELLRRIALLLGSTPAVARRIGVVMLTSPVLFFVSFIWVEQDIVGIALVLAGIYVILLEERGADRPWMEFAGFGLLAFSVFFYYFPIFLIPTLLVYSRTRARLVRRAVCSAATLVAFGLWFLVLPGWNFLTNSTGTAGFTSASPYSVLTLLQPRLFQSASSSQRELSMALVVVLIVLEVIVPVLLYRRGTPWVSSIALSMVFPFLFLDILNGDEFVWPLAFLLLAIGLLYPASARGPRLWLVEAYAIPMVVVMNLFDSPGPATGTGIFFLSYPQFHNALVVWALIPQYVLLTQVLDVLLWAGLASLAVFVVWVGRPAPRSSPRGTPQSATGAIASSPTEVDRTVGGLVRSARRSAKGRRARVVIGCVAACAILSVVTASLATPALTSNAQQEFPVGYFASYPVANASVTYAVSDGGRELVIAPNYGDPSALSQPWQTVNFSRNLATETLHLSLALTVQAPVLFPYNMTVLSFGSSGLNLLTPFVLPPESELLAPVSTQNVSSVGVSSPQFSSSTSTALTFDGSSFAEYNVSAWAGAGGNLTVFFRWAGVQLSQNLVAMLSVGNASYELFGQNDLYIAGEKPTAASPWTYTSPQLVNVESWHAFTLTVASHQLSLSLDGLVLPLPAVPVPTDVGAVLTLGDSGPSPDDFQEFDFVGTMVGPFYALGSLTQLASPMLCGFPSPPASGAACDTFVSPQVQADYSGGNAMTVTAAGASIRLPSTVPLFQVGRLSPVGPKVLLQATSMSISSSNPLLHLTWVMDGAMAAPVILGVWAWSSARRRPGGPP